MKANFEKKKFIGKLMKMNLKSAKICCCFGISSFKSEKDNTENEFIL